MAERQMIISIGREFGSGGHVIGEEIAAHYKLPLYDNNLLTEMAEGTNMDAEALKEFDEMRKSRAFRSRTVRGYNNSPEENIANLQFEYLREMASSGKSFVVIGRCAETVLKGNENLVTIFVLGDHDKKVERIAERDHVSKKEAEVMIMRMNKKRKNYHNFYSDCQWGDSRNYEISINSSPLGIEGTAQILEDYIDRRFS